MIRRYTNVVVANRLPVKVTKSGDTLTYIQSDGGLPTALSSLELKDQIWIGWPGIASDDLTAGDKKAITRELATRGCVPVFLTAQEIALFYEGYSNDTLWPLFHYFPSYMVNRDAYWQSYRDVNDKYRDATLAVAAETARIWVHDYQLMLLPKLLRAELPDSLIGYFHHIPFPSYEIYRLLPQRKELLEGLLGADLVGFHVYAYARHFLSSCLRLLGIPQDYGLLHVDGRLVRVDSFPISIDYDRFVAMRELPESVAQADALRETYDGQRIIFAEDRLDYSKGIPERLEGYRQFLEDNPEYLGQVVLLMIVSPSRTGVEAYQLLQERIEQLVSRINGEFGSAEWQPINYQFQTLSLEEIVPIFMAADTMLVTPRRDGMNLVAKEYVVAKGDDPGVLILSEMAGAVDELPEALVVNPNDTRAIADAIGQSFEMSDDNRCRRLRAMQRRIREYPVKRWGEDYLAALDAVRVQQLEAAVVTLGGSHLDEVQQAYNNATQRVLLLDYDGTLQNFKPTPDPAAAAPDSELHALVRTLARAPQTKVCIISGRGKDALEAWFGDTDAELVAEHGAWVRRNGTWHARDLDFEPARAAIAPVLADYTSRTPGSRIEQKDFATVWHYRGVPIDLARVRAYSIEPELRAALGDGDIGVYAGNKIVEIKPRAITKRAGVELVLNESNPEFILAVGDDYTDEDMFDAAGHDAVTVKVGPGETGARYRLPNVAAVHRLLRRLAGDAS